MLCFLIDLRLALEPNLSFSNSLQMASDVEKGAGLDNSEILCENQF